LEAVRAFGVMLGGSIALAAAAAASVAATARAALSFRPSAPALLGTGAAALYELVIRPCHLRWGAEPQNEQRQLPGDQFLPEHGTRIIRAVTIDAPVEQVWPWLAQLGQDRGGFYSYEWLENLAGGNMKNADRIHPEWQHRQLGERSIYTAQADSSNRLRAGTRTRPRGLGTFAVVPIGSDQTVLIARGACRLASRRRLMRRGRPHRSR
jgi:hypothetical protein